MSTDDLQPGQRVRVTQTIERRDGDWTSVTEGTVESLEQQKTGSWYAHGKDGKLWLVRLRLRKADGEITTLTLDSRTRLEPLPTR